MDPTISPNRLDSSAAAQAARTLGAMPNARPDAASTPGDAARAVTTATTSGTLGSNNSMRDGKAADASPV